MTPTTPASPLIPIVEDHMTSAGPLRAQESAIVEETIGQEPLSIDTTTTTVLRSQNQNVVPGATATGSTEYNAPIFIKKCAPGFSRAQAHEYPLSLVETPEFLQSFRFKIDGEEAVFREVDLLNDDEPCNSTALITAVPEYMESSPAQTLKRDRDADDTNNNNNITSKVPPLKKPHYEDVHDDSTPSESTFRDEYLDVFHPAFERTESTVDSTVQPPPSNVNVLRPAGHSIHQTHTHILDHEYAHALMPPPDVPATPADEEEEDDQNSESPHINLPSPSISPITGSRGLIPRVQPEERGSGSKMVASLRHVPAMIDSFDIMPDRLKNYVLYNLLRRCNRSSLSFLSELIVPALRSDFIALLPAELSYKILGYLDVKTLCAAAQVSKVWHNIVDNADWIWKDILDADDLSLEDGELERACKEKWGYTGWNNCPTPPKNIYKAIYRRKLLIRRNWMNPQSKPRHLAVLGHGRDVVTCLQFDDERIITGSDDSTINVYDTKTGKLLQRFEGHDGGVWALKYINKRTLVSGSTDRTVRVWDIEKAKCTHVFYGHTSTVRCLDTVMPVKNVDPVTNQVTYTPPHPLIITGSRDSTLRVWRLPKPDDAPYLPQSAAEAQGSFADPYFLRSLRGHTNSVRALSGYEDTVVSGSYDTTVRVWKISTGQCMWELTGHAQRVYSAVFDHKRNRCISGSMDWFVKVWSIHTGSLLYTLEGHTSLVGLLDLNRTTLVSAAADSTLRVWDPETGANIHKLGGHQGAITCFQHDESKVVSGSDPILKLWNIRTGTLVKNLLTDLNRIWQVCFDQRRCVAAVKRDQKTFIEVLDFDYDPETTTEEDSSRKVISSIDGMAASP